MDKFTKRFQSFNKSKGMNVWQIVYWVNFSLFFYEAYKTHSVYIMYACWSSCFEAETSATIQK